MPLSARPPAPLGHSSLALEVVSTSIQPPGALISDRFEIEEQLGRGGMAVVYRVRERTTGQRLALKQMTPPSDERQRAQTIAMFEREWSTLVALSHPHVVRVFDFGVERQGPFYLMELLDGGDLKELSPLSWQRACDIAFQVCSALALLHSRRLVHRDVTPRNIRCTPDGSAKLIDFGAMIAMGRWAQVVGTPAFVPPEVAAGAELDGRTDLFSLAASLYYGLTGRLAYPAASLASLDFSRRPALPSNFADVPPQLDELLMAMLSPEPASRPRNAFDVMQRVSAMAGRAHQESTEVATSYLATPALVGASRRLHVMRMYAQRAADGKGMGIQIVADAGMGRSRLLDQAVLDAKILGATVLRGDGESSGALLVARLLEQLVAALPEAFHRAVLREGAQAELYEPSKDASQEAIPDPSHELREITEVRLGTRAMQVALRRVILAVAEQHLLVLAVDDVHACQESAAALLAALSEHAPNHRLLLLVTAERGRARRESLALRALSARCRTQSLRPLGARNMARLVSSVLGDVPNVQRLATSLHNHCAGSPQECMRVLRHLVDRGALHYSAGAWSVPSDLGVATWPSNSDESYLARLKALPPQARELLECQALASHGPSTRADFLAMGILVGDGPPGEFELSRTAAKLEQALALLTDDGLLASDGDTYRIPRESRRQALLDAMPPHARVKRHRALARLYDRPGWAPMYEIDHLLRSEQETLALNRLRPLLSNIEHRHEFVYINAPMSVRDVATVLEQAVFDAERLGRPQLEVAELRHWLILYSAASSHVFHERHAAVWFKQVEQDSGLGLWRAATHLTDPGERLTYALTSANARHLALPEEERVYSVQEGIKALVHYVASSIAVGARLLDGSLLASLPEMLAPFSPLSPLIDAIRENAVATYEALCICQPERARDRWERVYDRLGEMGEQDLEYVNIIRTAIAYGVGAVEVRLGLDASARFLERLDADPFQEVNAMHLRRLGALLRGDSEDAERCSKAAELLAVQAVQTQMFNNTLPIELGAHVLSGDLTGIKRALDGLCALSHHGAAWRAYAELAQGQLERARGQSTLAKAPLERCLALCSPDPMAPNRCLLAWPAATAAYIEVLAALGEVDSALSFGREALSIAAERQMGVIIHEARRTFALVQAQAGDIDTATASMRELVEEQRALGVGGLHLGASYEALTRIAIRAGDRAGVAHYGALCAHEYRYGTRSALSARYERLIEEAQRAKVLIGPTAAEFQGTAGSNATSAEPPRWRERVDAAMASASDSAGRSQAATALLCESAKASLGALFLYRDGALQCTGAKGIVSDEPLLRSLAIRRAEAELEADVTDTLALTGATSSAEMTMRCTDTEGRQYYPHMLTAVREGILYVVGVAVLESVEEGDPPPPSLTSAISEALRSDSDAQALEV